MGADGGPVTYAVTFPEPEHHWMQVEVTFTDLGAAPLDARMSRSSPGRYSVHEFAKNVFSVEAFDGQRTHARVDAARRGRVAMSPATTAPCASSTRFSATTRTARTSASTRRTRT